MKVSIRELDDVGWDDFSPKARARVPELLLDVFGCAAEGRRMDPYPNLHPCTDGDAVVWFANRRAGAPEAALLNGTFAHHAELDDGNPRAGLHGGVTIVPAVLAVAEMTGASGTDVLTAIACGYAAAVACGRPLLPGIERHRLHPPSMVGCLGAASAAGRLLFCAKDALSLAGTFMPLGPFESFTRGAPVKDLYGGYPAFIGVQAALLAREGITGPDGLFRTVRDGTAAFLADGTPSEPLELELDEVLHVELKPWPACRSVHATLSALEKLLPLDESVSSIRVETYSFAAELSWEANESSPIGARVSIPHNVELMTGVVSDRIEVVIADDVGPRGARVTVRFADGRTRSAETRSPRSETNARPKFRRLAGERAKAIETAVDHLSEATDVRELTRALSDAVAL